MYSAARSSSSPPISPHITISSVSRVLLEQLDDVDEARAGDRVAADADDRRVAEAALGQLVADLVGQRARARHEPDVALREEVRRDDPDVGLARRQDAGAVRADQARAAALQVRVDAQHVVRRDALGDRDDELDRRRRRPRGSSRRRSAAARRSSPCWRRSPRPRRGTVSKTGTPSTSWPPLPGVTPATRSVP